MKLLTKEIAKLFPPLYSQENVDDPIVVAKWFSPYTGWRWYAIEGEKNEEGDDWTFFGLVQGFEDELGYWTLSELDSVKALGGRLPLVERDLYWKPVPLSQARDGRI